MWRMKQGPIGRFKKRRYKLKNHKHSREKVKKMKNDK
jgi:hypothetical protein